MPSGNDGELMATALLLAMIGLNVVWEVPRVQSVVWVVPAKPADPPRPDPPPPAPELSGCENGQCQPRRMVWRRRR